MRNKAAALLLITAVILGCFDLGKSYANSNLLNEDDSSGDDEPNTTIEADHASNIQNKCPPSTTQRTDQFVDKVLNEVRPKLTDAVSLPERKGRFKLFNGTLQNLESLKRVGPSFTRCSDSTFSFLVPLSLNNLFGKYNWEFHPYRRMMLLNGTISIIAEEVRGTVFYTRTRKDLEHFYDSPPKAFVEKVKITNLEGLRVSFNGLGPFNSVVSRFTNFVAKHFSIVLAHVLEDPLRDIINEELQNVEKYESFYF